MPRWGREDLGQDARQDHPRDEVREVGNGLHHPLVQRHPHLVEQQRQDDGTGKPEQQAQHAQPEGVEKHTEKERILEQAPEVLEVVPRAAQHAVVEVVVLEGDQQPVDRAVLEHHQQGHGEQQQQVDVAHADRPRDGLPLEHAAVRGDRLLAHGCRRMWVSMS